MTIIHLRGTSGSGKTHLARRVMEQYAEPTTYDYKIGRKQPLATICNQEGGPSLFLPGHYNSPCGGCDTISEVDEVFGMIRGADGGGMDVLYEGLLLAADIQRTLALHTEGRTVHAVLLTTTLEECLSSVNARRQAKRGPDAPPVNPKNTASKHRGCLNAIRALRAAGVSCHELSRDDALVFCREVLDV